MLTFRGALWITAGTEGTGVTQPVPPLKNTVCPHPKVGAVKSRVAAPFPAAPGVPVKAREPKRINGVNILKAIKSPFSQHKSSRVCFS